MTTLHLTTCQAGNTDAVTAGIAAQLADRLGLSIHVVDDLDWPARYAAIASGTIEIGWTCGRPFAQFLQRPDVDVELLAVPVYAAPRYGDAPIYFSDVIVRAGSPIRRFDDLRGRTFAINEPNSMSGWQTVRRHLRAMDAPPKFFGRLHETGGHVASIGAVRDGRADAAAIDSTVWEWRTAAHPALLAELRVIETIGPTPGPPWVISRQVDPALRQRLRHALLHLHMDPAGRAALAVGGLRRFDAGVQAAYAQLAE